MDEWETVNDVLGWYHPSLPTDQNIREGWDCFKFSISLGQDGLEKRVLWLVGKYVGAAQTKPGENPEAAGEWWDNNEGKNYRVGFSKLDQEESPAEEEKKETEKVYKRGVVVSAPGQFFPSSFSVKHADTPSLATYTSPVPKSTFTRPTLSPAQLSPSLSLPSSGLQQHYQYHSQYQQERVQQHQEREKERERDRAQHQAAIAQSTLARLKKLNLKNYAAPKGYGQQQAAETSGLTTPALTLTSASPTSTPSASSPSSSPPNLTLNTTLEASSPTLSSSSSMDLTSTDSTPVHTPVHGNEERWKVDVDPGKEDEEHQGSSLRWSLGMENGHFATTLMSSDSGALSPPPAPIPISIPSATASTEMGTSPPFSDLSGSVAGRRGGFIYWDWGSAGGAAVGSEEKEVRKEPLWMNQSALMPPQRKRGHHQQRGSGSSSSGSGSDSNSGGKHSNSSTAPTSVTSSPSLTTIAPSSTTTTTTASSPPPTPPKQKPSPPKLSLPASSPSVSAPAGNGGVQSPYPGSPRRGLHSRSANGYGRQFQPMPSGFGSPLPQQQPSGAGEGSSDAIYQALVREWCFAQGSGPPAAAGSGGGLLDERPGSGQATPVPLNLGTVGL